MSKTTLDYALEYLQKGYSVIPIIYKGKTPNTKLLPNGWKEYQKRRPTVEEIKSWFSTGNSNIAIITGKISGIVVVDVDSYEAYQWCKAQFDVDTLTVRTSRGYHLYYRYPENSEIKNSVHINGMEIDIRADGGYVVAPPSIHESGHQYRWLNQNALIKPLPEIFLKQNTTGGLEPRMLYGVEKGERNIALTKVAGMCFGKGFTFDETLDYCMKWNNFNEPPLPEKEVLKTVKSIYTKEINKRANKFKAKKKSEDKTLLEITVEIILENVQDFFEDNQLNFFAILKDGTYLLMNSKKFKRLVNGWVIEQLGRPVSPTTISDAIRNVEGLKEGKVKKINLSTRVAKTDDAIFYDLGDYKCVKIDTTNGNVEIIQSPPLFYIFPHQLPQCEPNLDAEPKELFKLFELINIKDEPHQLLLIAYILFSFIPHLPYPILILFGSQGTGKTTTARILKSIIDPSCVDILTFKSFEDFYVNLLHHHLVVLDNLTSVSPALADELCRVATGGGIAKRQLYTDADMVFYSYKRPQILTGINLISSQPDLLDRSVIIQLDKIKERLTEQELQKRLKELKPKILGAIFNTIAKTFSSFEPKPKINGVPVHLPRMGDYALHGYNFVETLGLNGAEFLQAYNSNRKNTTREIVDNTPLASIVLKFLEDEGHYQGTTAGLLEKLRKVASDLNIPENTLPKTPNAFKRKLNTLKTTLEDIGIFITEKHNGSQRILTLKMCENDELVPEAEKVPNFEGDVDDELPF